MAWIESHTVLVRHRKLLELAITLQTEAAHCVGYLHCLWHTALEQQEDGDLSEWSNSLIAKAAQWPGDADEFVSALQLHGWLDESLIHDWIDYTGPFLIRKYSSGNIDKLKDIWLKHGYKYGKGKGKFIKQKASRKRVESEVEVILPNQPNQPNQPTVVCEKFDEFWQAYPARNGKKLEKGATDALFRKLSDEDQALVVQAARNYADALTHQGINPKDPKRFLRSGNGEEPWRDWLTPATLNTPSRADPHGTIAGMKAFLERGT